MSPSAGGFKSASNSAARMPRSSSAVEEGASNSGTHLSGKQFLHSGNQGYGVQRADGGVRLRSAHSGTYGDNGAHLAGEQFLQSGSQGYGVQRADGGVQLRSATSGTFADNGFPVIGYTGNIPMHCQQHVLKSPQSYRMLLPKQKIQEQQHVLQSPQGFPMLLPKEHINFHGGIQWVGCYTSDGAFGNVVNNSYWHGLPGYSAWQLQHNNAMPTGVKPLVQGHRADTNCANSGSDFNNASSNGYFSKLLSSSEMEAGRGPLQDLLRDVSSQAENYLGGKVTNGTSKEDGQCVTTGTSGDCRVNVTDNGEENEESESEIDEDDEYQDADDEGSDGICQEETTMEWISKPASDLDKALEFEIVEINNKQKGGVKKRRRFPKGYEVPDHRAAREIGTIEKAMRNASTRSTTHIFEPKLGMVFDSRIEAYQFYNLYSWYLKWNESRWRHFLPTDFAIWALKKDRGEPPLHVQQMFYGCNIQYRVADCRLIMVPVLVHWCWCLYVWDFKRELVVVLDPRGTDAKGETLERKHKITLRMIHSAMKECHEKFLNDYNYYMDDWGMEYVSINIGQVESINTGLYTMFCARYFDGEVVTRVLTKEATQLQRVNLMYQLFEMEDNAGNLPKSLL